MKLILVILSVLFLVPILVSILRAKLNIPSGIVPYLAVIVSVLLCLTIGLVSPELKLGVLFSILLGAGAIGVRELLDRALLAIGFKEKRFIAKVGGSKSGGNK